MAVLEEYPSTAVHAPGAWILGKDIKTVMEEGKQRVIEVLGQQGYCAEDAIGIEVFYYPDRNLCYVTLTGIYRTPLPNIVQALGGYMRSQDSPTDTFFDIYGNTINPSIPPGMVRIYIDVPYSSSPIFQRDESQEVPVDWAMGCATIEEIKDVFAEGVMPCLVNHETFSKVQLSEVALTGAGYSVTLGGVPKGREEELSNMLGYAVFPMILETSLEANGVPAVPIPGRAQFLIPFLREIHPGKK